MITLDKVHSLITEAFKAGNRARKKESMQDAVSITRKVPFEKLFKKVWKSVVRGKIEAGPDCASNISEIFFDGNCDEADFHIAFKPGLFDMIQNNWDNQDSPAFNFNLGGIMPFSAWGGVDKGKDWHEYGDYFSLDGFVYYDSENRKLSLITSNCSAEESESHLSEIGNPNDVEVIRRLIMELDDKYLNPFKKLTEASIYDMEKTPRKRRPRAKVDGTPIKGRFNADILKDINYADETSLNQFVKTLVSNEGRDRTSPYYPIRQLVHFFDLQGGAEKTMWGADAKWTLGMLRKLEPKLENCVFTLRRAHKDLIKLIYGKDASAPKGHQLAIDVCNKIKGCIEAADIVVNKINKHKDALTDSKVWTGDKTGKQLGLGKILYAYMMKKDKLLAVIKKLETIAGNGYNPMSYTSTGKRIMGEAFRAGNRARKKESVQDVVQETNGMQEQIDRFKEQTGIELEIRGGRPYFDKPLYLEGCTRLTDLPIFLKVEGCIELRDCTELTSLPVGLETNALSLTNCTGLTSVPANLKVNRLILIDCTGLTSLPTGLKVGEELCLEGCTGLTSIPADLEVGKDLELDGCTGLTSLPAGLEVNRDLNLEGCTGLSSLPAGLKVGRDLYLGGCTGLTSLPADLEVNGELYREDCTGLGEAFRAGNRARKKETAVDTVQGVDGEQAKIQQFVDFYKISSQAAIVFKEAYKIIDACDFKPSYCASWECFLMLAAMLADDDNPAKLVFDLGYKSYRQYGKNNPYDFCSWFDEPEDILDYYQNELRSNETLMGLFKKMVSICNFYDITPDTIYNYVNGDENGEGEQGYFFLHES